MTMLPAKSESGLRPLQVPTEALREAENFLYHEARLLDERRFEEWVDLFDEDGVYWVPSEPGQRSAAETLSIFYEDKALLRVRMRRLAHPQTHADSPPTRTHHHVSAISAQPARMGDDRIETHSMLVYVAWRSETQTWFSGRCTHLLRATSGGLRIVEKRVDLLNSDAPHRGIVVPF